MPNRSFGRTSRGQTISISAERVSGQTKRNRQNFIGLVFDVRIGRTWDPENKKQANYVNWCRVSSGTKKKKGEGCSGVPNVYNMARKQRRPCQGSESLNK